ncbi:MAG: CPBP family intramembrane metalloprotease [Deltaproteobacteria bacterium]|nr:CPBP family intramembrane metalloprotease [Deltaproteobacteria bacterium]
MTDPPPNRAPFADAAIVYVVLMATIVTLKRLAGFGFVGRNLLFLAALVFLSVPIVAMRHRGESLDSFGMTSRNAWREILFALLAAGVIFPPFVVGYHLYQKVWFHHAPLFNMPKDVWRLASIHLLLVALPEEFFYRGYIQGKLKRVLPGGLSLMGARAAPAIVLTAALFALGHFIVDFRPMRLGVFFPALLFGWMKEKTGTVTAPIVFHALSNVFMATLEKTYFHP